MTGLRSVAPAASGSGGAAGRAGRQRTRGLPLAAGEGGSVQLQMWLDLRSVRVARTLDPVGMLFNGVNTEKPKAKELLAFLRKDLQEKLDQIGVPKLKGKLVDAVLVDGQWADSVAGDVEDLGLPVYTVSQKVEELKLPKGALFVMDPRNQFPIGGLDPVPAAISAGQRPTPLNIWAILPEDEKKAEAERLEMERYMEGLDDPDKYVPPSQKRLGWMFGLDEKDLLPMERGPVWAKVIPPHTLLWARALMQQRKDAGMEMTYQIRSDRD